MTGVAPAKPSPRRGNSGCLKKETGRTLPRLGALRCCVCKSPDVNRLRGIRERDPSLRLSFYSTG